MRWACWRRARRAPRGLPEPVHRQTGSSPASARGSTTPDDESEARRATPAFSGAQPGRTPAPPERLHLPDALSDAPAHVQAAVVDIVRALVDDDPPRLQRLRDELAQREGRTAAAASVALIALGPRLLEAADVAADEARAGGVAAAAVLAQGETLATRAEALRRRLAPGCPPELLRFVVRDAVGADVSGPRDARSRAAGDADLLMATAVLLAQGMADGQGDPAALAQELVELLPGG